MSFGQTAIVNIIVTTFSSPFKILFEYALKSLVFIELKKKSLKSWVFRVRANF